MNLIKEKIQLSLKITKSCLVIIASLFLNNLSAVSGNLPEQWVTRYDGRDFFLTNTQHAEIHCLMSEEQCALRVCYDSSAKATTSFVDSWFMDEVIGNAWDQIIKNVIVDGLNKITLQGDFEAILAEKDPATGIIYYGRAVFDQISLIIRRTVTNTVYELVTAFPTNARNKKLRRWD